MHLSGIGENFWCNVSGSLYMGGVVVYHQVFNMELDLMEEQVQWYRLGYQVNVLSGDTVCGPADFALLTDEQMGDLELQAYAGGATPPTHATVWYPLRGPGRQCQICGEMHHTFLETDGCRHHVCRSAYAHIRMGAALSGRTPSCPYCRAQYPY